MKFKDLQSIVISKGKSSSRNVKVIIWNKKDFSGELTVDPIENKFLVSVRVPKKSNYTKEDLGKALVMLAHEIGHHKAFKTYPSDALAPPGEMGVEIRAFFFGLPNADEWGIFPEYLEEILNYAAPWEAIKVDPIKTLDELRKKYLIK